MYTIGKLIVSTGMVFFLQTCVGCVVYMYNSGTFEAMARSWQVLSSASMGVMLCGFAIMILSE